jgi:hypothetical protein
MLKDEILDLKTKSEVALNMTINSAVISFPSFMKAHALGGHFVEQILEAFQEAGFNLCMSSDGFTLEHKLTMMKPYLRVGVCCVDIVHFVMADRCSPASTSTLAGQ